MRQSGGGGNRGGGSSGAGFALAALGLLAIAATGSIVVVNEIRAVQLERERRDAARVQSTSLTTGRLARSSRSIETCQEHRVRPRLIPICESAELDLGGDMLIDGLPASILPMIAVFMALPSLWALQSVSSRFRATLGKLVANRTFVKEAARKGAFNCSKRFHIWMAILNCKERFVESAHLYRQLVAISLDPLDGDENSARIRRDIARTMPDVSIFRPGRQGSETLYRVLRSYSLSDPEIGYCQGMNYITAALLYISDDEPKTYAMLDLIMKEYQFRWMYAPGLPQLCLCLWQLDRLMAMFLPELHLHFTAEHVSTDVFASEWFISLFTYTFLVDEVAQIWDLFLVSGWKELHRIALGILAISEPTLLSIPFESIIQHLKQTPSSARPGMVKDVLQRSCQFKVTNTLLEALEDQFWAEAQVNGEDQ